MVIFFVYIEKKKYFCSGKLKLLSGLRKITQCIE